MGAKRLASGYTRLVEEAGYLTSCLARDAMFRALAADEPGDWRVVAHRLAAVASRVEAAAPVPSLTCPPRCLATIDRMLETLRSIEFGAEHRDEIMREPAAIEALTSGWTARVRRPAER
jgi:hypothetical protein